MKQTLAVILGFIVLFSGAAAALAGAFSKRGGDQFNTEKISWETEKEIAQVLSCAISRLSNEND